MQTAVQSLLTWGLQATFGELFELRMEKEIGRSTVYILCYLVPTNADTRIVIIHLRIAVTPKTSVLKQG